MWWKRLSAVLDEVKVTDDWWLTLSPLGVTSSRRELFMRGRRMSTRGLSVMLPREHNSMEWWTSVSQSQLTILVWCIIMPKIFSFVLYFISHSVYKMRYFCLFEICNKQKTFQIKKIIMMPNAVWSPVLSIVISGGSPRPADPEAAVRAGHDPAAVHRNCGGGTSTITINRVQIH